MRKKMKGFLMAAFAATMLFGTTLTSEAAPKTMPDGQIFDAQFYAQSYPDVVAAFGNDENLLYSHYVFFGKSEGRLPYAGTQGAADTKKVHISYKWNAAETDLGNGTKLVAPITLTYTCPEDPDFVLDEAGFVQIIKKDCPNGFAWGLETFYDKISTVTNKKDMNVRAQGCLAFAYWLTDGIYGDLPIVAYNGAEAGFEFCMYDIVVFNTPYTAATGQYHAGVIIGADPATQTLYLAEANVIVNGNPQGVIRWDSPLKVDGSDGNTIGMVLRRKGVTP